MRGEQRDAHNAAVPMHTLPPLFSIPMLNAQTIPPPILSVADEDLPVVLATLKLYMFLDIDRPIDEQQASHPGARIRAVVRSKGYDPLSMHVPEALLSLDGGAPTRSYASDGAAAHSASTAQVSSFSSADRGSGDAAAAKPAVSPAATSSRHRGPNLHRSAAGETLTQSEAAGSSSAPTPQRERGVHRRRRGRRRPSHETGGTGGLGEAPSESEMSDANAANNIGRKVTAGQVSLRLAFLDDFPFPFLLFLAEHSSAFTRIFQMRLSHLSGATGRSAVCAERRQTGKSPDAEPLLAVLSARVAQ